MTVKLVFEKADTEEHRRWQTGKDLRRQTINNKTSPSQRR